MHSLNPSLKSLYVGPTGVAATPGPTCVKIGSVGRHPAFALAIANEDPEASSAAWLAAKAPGLCTTRR